MSAQPNPRYFEFSGVSKAFDGPAGPAVVVEGFDLKIVEGEFLCLIGHSGCGKSTVLSMAAGMRQRVGLARAFALSPRVLLLDEPFGMLDSLSRLELQEALLELWRKDRKTALMITHDVDEALFLSDRIAMMTQGPGAKVGDTLTVPFDRPRNRRAILDDPRYYALREQIIDFLEAEDARVAHAAQVVQAEAAGPSSLSSTRATRARTPAADPVRS